MPYMPLARTMNSLQIALVAFFTCVPFAALVAIAVAWYLTRGNQVVIVNSAHRIEIRVDTTVETHTDEPNPWSAASNNGWGNALQDTGNWDNADFNGWEEIDNNNNNIANDGWGPQLANHPVIPWPTSIPDDEPTPPRCRRRRH